MSVQHSARNLVSVQEAATRYGVTPKTIRRWIASGNIPAYRLGTSLLRLDVDDVDNFLRRVPTGGMK